MYFVIKRAVRNGIQEAYYNIKPDLKETDEESEEETEEIEE